MIGEGGASAWGVEEEHMTEELQNEAKVTQNEAKVKQKIPRGVDPTTGTH
jgi:hypothetical protein